MQRSAPVDPLGRAEFVAVIDIEVFVDNEIVVLDPSDALLLPIPGLVEASALLVGCTWLQVETDFVSVVALHFEYNEESFDGSKTE